MPSPGKDILFELIQNVSNQVLELAKGQSGLESCMRSIKKQIENVESRIDLMSIDQTRIKEILQKKMTPDRCGMMHDDVKNQIAREISDTLRPNCDRSHEHLKKEIFKEMRDGAKGWVRTTTTALKILAYAGALFGGGALGANQIQTLLGGG